MCVPGVYRGQKWALETIKLELQRVMSHHVAAGNQILLFHKSSQGLLTTEQFLRSPENCLLKKFSPNAFHGLLSVKSLTSIISSVPTL